MLCLASCSQGTLKIKDGIAADAGGSGNLWGTGGHPAPPNYYYSEVFDGTSSASAMVAGVVPVRGPRASGLSRTSHGRWS